MVKKKKKGKKRRSKKLESKISKDMAGLGKAVVFGAVTVAATKELLK